MQTPSEQDQIRAAVRERYGKIAETDGAYGVKINADPDKPCCCSGGNKAAASPETLGYDAADLEGIPEGAEMGLGCGNPVAIATIRQLGEIALQFVETGKKVAPAGDAQGVVGCMAGEDHDQSLAGDLQDHKAASSWLSSALSAACVGVGADL